MLFNKKTSNTDQNADENSVKKRKKLATVDIIMLIFSVMLALALWTYVYQITNVEEEKTFNLVSIEKKNTSDLFEKHNLVVQSVNIDTVNITVMGSRDVIKNVTSSDISAYINFVDINEAGEYKMTVQVDFPEGITLVSQTVSYVEVTVDFSTEKVINVGPDNVILSGWTLEEGFSFGEITTNLRSVKLEGAQNDINKISSVGLVTGTLGSVKNSMTSNCSLVLLDANGNELKLPGVYVTTDVSISDIEAHITVYKEKTVPLELRYTYGHIDEGCVTITPSHVVIRGEASAVDGIDRIVIGSIDEKNISYPVYETEFDVSYEGVQVLDGSGNTVSRASVKIDRTSFASRTVEGVALYRNGIFSGYVDVLLVVRRNDESCRMFLDSITAENLRAYTQSGFEGYAVELSGNYSGYLYDCGVTPAVAQ